MLRFLHFCDNQKVPEKTYDNYDQRKIKTIFNKLNDSTLHLTDQLMKLLCYSSTKSFSNSIYQRNTTQKIWDQNLQTLSVHIRKDKQHASFSTTATI